MIATANVIFDRSYFELQYDEWLRHRSKFKRYEIWFAIALTLFGVTLAVAFQNQWLVGALFAAAGVYEFVMAATHKRRWVDARVATVRDDKSVDIQFDTDSLTSMSANGTATMRLSGFTGFTKASKGFFLIPDTGVLIYVPRATIDPSDSYSSLVELLGSRIASPIDPKCG
ncbi:hypothetical protein [Crateriforma spongiae]|uniref:hypothetical protein n=1 Tax=Crateriforma spongiae TaxID=2724528 RepID=UPI001446C267|nr:hypothetical protein [Crateriforma spongiae]